MIYIKGKGRYSLRGFKKVNDITWETDVYRIWLDDRKDEIGVEWLTIARKDNKPVDSWYDIWNIKNKIWGDISAIEYYPSRENLIDGQNQRHLFKLPEGVRKLIGLYVDINN